MGEKLSKLLTVKSIVTLVLTGVFAFLSVKGFIAEAQFMAIFTMVIGFYFGTQHEKKNSEGGNSNV